METKTIKQMVEDILKEVPESRNSDVKLTIELWKRFYPSRIRTDSEGVMVVALYEMFDLPREDICKRYRAKFQNDELKYLPTSWVVAKQRKLNEEVWRREMGMGDAHARLNNNFNQ